MTLPLVSLGAAGASPLVLDLAVCLVTAAVLAVVFLRLRIPTIAAFLAAGVIVGPIGLAAVQERASIETIANLGLTLLLFVIGLEVNLRSLLASGRTLVVTGLLQVPLTAAFGLGFFLVLDWLGLLLIAGRYIPLYLGIATAFSSTLLVVKLLQERLQLDSIAGRLCVGLLIFQDVWAIVILAVQPSFDAPALRPIALTLAGIFVVIAVAVAAARFVLPAVFRLVADIPELVVTVALGWCFGLGLFGAHLGGLLHLVGIDTPISVSMEMGALIAGASIASFPYAHEVVARVTHLRDFFVTLFFVGLGMSIPVPSGVTVLLVALGVSVATVLFRYAVFFPLLYVTGLDRRNAIETATKLAPVSEFCLVIVYLGMRLGHVDETLVSVIILAFVLTALATPALFRLSEDLYDRIHPLLTALGFRARGATAETQADAPPRLVLLGFHRIASALVHDLERLHPEVLPQTLVVDLNVAVHDAIRARGVEVAYGNITSAETLKHARVNEAEVIVSTVPDELLKGTNGATLARSLRALAPQATILVCASRTSAIRELLDAGADYAFTVPAEAAHGLLGAIYASLNGSLPSFIESHEHQLGRLVDRKEVLD
jgi:Kef-type K+ transport system membrane component KefB